MAFRKRSATQPIELTSLIDLVFLLLIFFLVAFAFSLSGEASESLASASEDLPQAETAAATHADDILRNLMISVFPDTLENSATRKVYVLWPSDQGNGISEREAMRVAIRDSAFASFPTDFLQLSKTEFNNSHACRLIANSIRRYVGSEEKRNPNHNLLLDVRAERNTEFKIISFIMNQCSSYQDRIPQIVIRTAQ